VEGGSVLHHAKRGNCLGGEMSGVVCLGNMSRGNLATLHGRIASRADVLYELADVVFDVSHHATHVVANALGDTRDRTYSDGCI